MYMVQLVNNMHLLNVRTAWCLRGAIYLNEFTVHMYLVKLVDSVPAKCTDSLVSEQGGGVLELAATPLPAHQVIPAAAAAAA